MSARSRSPSWICRPLSSHAAPRKLPGAAQVLPKSRHGSTGLTTRGAGENAAMRSRSHCAQRKSSPDNTMAQETQKTQDLVGRCSACIGSDAVRRGTHPGDCSEGGAARERLPRSGKREDFDRLFRRPTAYSAHTRQTLTRAGACPLCRLCA